MKKKFKPKGDVPGVFSDLRSILQEIEERNFFELSGKTKDILSTFDGSHPLIPKIEACSFVPHPKVIDALSSPSHRLHRYIVTIDTLRSYVYGPVEAFLRDQKTNVTSYFTGGWADFICDIVLEESKFETFLSDLKNVLTTNGVNEVGKLDELISVFQVNSPLIICHRRLDGGVVTPTDECVSRIVQNRAWFEVLMRDYKSDDARKLFENDPKKMYARETDNKIKASLRKLKGDGLIVCYRIVLDYAFGLLSDYVPMIMMGQGDSTMQRFLEHAKVNQSLLKPVRELLKVTPRSVADEAEEKVNYFFLNDYEFPGERQRWKHEVYERYQDSKIGVNLYNYPLEGTLNESPIYLSDLPERLSRARYYGEDDGGMNIGTLDVGSAISSPPSVRMPIRGLSQHGITLGESGSGKTNTDLVIAQEALRHLRTVVILDPTSGTADKIEGVPKGVFGKILYTSVSAATSEAELKEAYSFEGLVVMTMTSDEPHQIFANVMKAISSEPDNVSGNEERRLERLLIVEEAGEVLGRDSAQKKESVAALDQLLTKTWRKGWSIWLSTQRPSQIGSSDLILRLKSRVVGKLKEGSEVGILMEVFRQEDCSDEDLGLLKSSLPTLSLGTFFVRGVSVMPPDTDVNLPICLVKVRNIANT